MGAATAVEAARDGHRLILVDRDEAGLEVTAAAASDAGSPRISLQVADVSDERQVVSAIDRGVSEAGLPSGTVCFAGVDQGGASHELNVAVWDRVIGVNLRGVFLTCRSVLGHLVSADAPGAIVCVSSIFASVSIGTGTAAYSASKGGVSSLVRSLALEYAARGIRVNSLAPGATETALMWANVEPAEEAAMRETIRAEVPLGRVSTPAEQARAALWLLSQDAAYMTGAELVLDGGVRAVSALSV